MTKRPKPKSRVRAEKVRVIIHNRDGDEPPGYSGHNGGSFADAGYAPGRGQFGFRHHTLTGKANQ